MSKVVSEMCNKKYEQNHVMVYIKLLWISLDLIKIVHYFLEVLERVNYILNCIDQFLHLFFL